MGVKLTRRGLWKVLLAITNRREGNIGNEVGTPRERRQLAQTKPDQNPWASMNAEPHLIILLSLSLPQQHCTIKRKRFQKCVKQRGKCAQLVCCWERTGLNQGKRWMMRLLEGQQWPRTPIVTSVSEPKRFTRLSLRDKWKAEINRDGIGEVWNGWSLQKVGRLDLWSMEQRRCRDDSWPRPRKPELLFLWFSAGQNYRVQTSSSDVVELNTSPDSS